MTPRRRLAGLGAFALASALVLSACGGGGNAGDDAPEAEGPSTGVVSFANGEPQNPLIPTHTNEVYGSAVVTNLFSGLVYYDAEGVPQNEVAESIESDDKQNWTITLQDGWTFSDDTPVTAQSFVDAWNYGAYGKNAQNLSYFFEPIEGFADVQVPTDENGEPTGEPKAETMSGLKVVSDTEFTVTLSQPESDFPLRLGYSAFYPLPESFFEDPEKGGQEPVGNGPYQLESWEHESLITLTPREGYEGPREPQNGGLELVVYTAEDASYNDLLDGNVDLVREVASSALGTFEDELGERAINQPAAQNQTLAVPEWLPEFQGEAGLLRRQAIAAAIDRAQITETIFSGSRTPATDFTSPVIEGWTENLPGSEVLEYDAERAKQLWTEAEAADPVGADYTLQIASNADANHQPWIDAVCNNIRTVLEIGCEFYPYPTFDEFLDARDNGQVPGLFRAGWLADYPAASNFLGPVFGTDAGSNDVQYSSKEFDDLMRQGNGAASTEEALEFYNQAQGVLFADLPAIPLWYENSTGGFAETVDNVQFGWDGEPILYAVTKQG